ncbi:RNA polymerase sigma factor RpoD [Nymphon striatum]|nr:RNA polymerase sigma factor RpoD [Nymphon striatum]
MRHGAASVTQLEIMPQPPEKEDKGLVWPDWPNKMRTSTSQEEGKEAAWRALENAMPVMQDGKEIKFLFLPDGEDPDTQVRKIGKEAFEENYQQAESLTAYFVENLHSRFNITVSQTPIRYAISLLLSEPSLVSLIENIEEIAISKLPGSDLLTTLIEAIQESPEIKPIALLDRWKNTEFEVPLIQLMKWQPESDDLSILSDEFRDCLLQIQKRLTDLISDFVDPNAERHVIPEPAPIVTPESKEAAEKKAAEAAEDGDAEDDDEEEVELEDTGPDPEVAQVKFTELNELYVQACQACENDDYEEYEKIRQVQAQKMLEFKLTQPVIDEIGSQLHGIIERIRGYERQIMKLCVQKAAMPKKDFITSFPKNETDTECLNTVVVINSRRMRHGGYVQAITRSIADQARTIRIPVHMIETINKLNRISRKLLQEKGREGTPEELAVEMEMPEDKVRKVMKIAKEPISMETPIGDDEDSSLGDFIEDGNVQSPIESATSTGLGESTRDVLSSLTPREAKVLRMRFGIDMNTDHTLEELCKRLNKEREFVMLNLEDIIGMCDCTEEEIEAVAAHEHVPEAVASELANYIIHSDDGIPKLRRIIVEDIEDAQSKGQTERVAHFKEVLKHFIAAHPVYLEKAKV